MRCFILKLKLLFIVFSIVFVANKCAYTLVTKLETEAPKCAGSVLGYIASQVVEEKELDDDYILSLLQLLQKVKSKIKI